MFQIVASYKLNAASPCLLLTGYKIEDQLSGDLRGLGGSNFNRRSDKSSVLCKPSRVMGNLFSVKLETSGKTILLE